MNIFEYMAFVSAYIYYVVLNVFRRNALWIGKMFEGISVGIYANLIGDIVKGETGIELLILLTAGIILTINSVILSRKD